MNQDISVHLEATSRCRVPMVNFARIMEWTTLLATVRQDFSARMGVLCQTRTSVLLDSTVRWEPVFHFPALLEPSVQPQGTQTHYSVSVVDQDITAVEMEIRLQQTSAQLGSSALEGTKHLLKSAQGTTSVLKDHRTRPFAQKTRIKATLDETRVNLAHQDLSAIHMMEIWTLSHAL